MIRERTWRASPSRRPRRSRPRTGRGALLTVRLAAYMSPPLRSQVTISDPRPHLRHTPHRLQARRRQLSGRRLGDAGLDVRHRGMRPGNASTAKLLRRPPSRAYGALRLLVSLSLREDHGRGGSPSEVRIATRTSVDG